MRYRPLSRQPVKPLNGEIEADSLCLKRFFCPEYLNFFYLNINKLEITMLLNFCRLAGIWVLSFGSALVLQGVRPPGAWRKDQVFLFSS